MRCNLPLRFRLPLGLPRIRATASLATGSPETLASLDCRFESGITLADSAGPGLAVVQIISGAHWGEFYLSSPRPGGQGEFVVWVRALPHRSE